MIGKKYEISGMTLEITADAGEKWQTINITTKEIVYFNKTQLQNAIKLGKASEVLDDAEEQVKG
ncbi:MAG: hypothetical protein DRQ44_07850 [Gammaproteobacteria bacterium]|nr:MAG: hypothetical protein DRQ44_07850 [Gammaproteobacteria bacterium]